jgi:hypothetical protein
MADQPGFLYWALAGFAACGGALLAFGVYRALNEKSISLMMIAVAVSYALREQFSFPSLFALYVVLHIFAKVVHEQRPALVSKHLEEQAKEKRQHEDEQYKSVLPVPIPSRPAPPLVRLGLILPAALCFWTTLRVHQGLERFEDPLFERWFGAFGLSLIWSLVGTLFLVRAIEGVVIWWDTRPSTPVPEPRRSLRKP